MKKIGILLLFTFAVFSCSSDKQIKSQNKNKNQPTVITKGITNSRFTEPLIKQEISGNIVGQGLSTPQQMSQFLMNQNPGLNPEKTLIIAQTYYNESSKEGINHDIAFAQMCLETAFLKYGNQVQPEQNNFCGLGALDGGASGAHFESIEIGVRAHIQHLKAYASKNPVNEKLVDPRFRYVKRGVAPTVDELSGRWASDRKYGEKIRAIVTRLYQLNELK